MKKLLPFIFLFVTINVNAQDSLPPNPGKMIFKVGEKEHIDSLVRVIERDKKTYSVVTDTVKVTDINDPSKFVYSVYWKYYYDKSRELKMIVLLEKHPKEQTYYYFDSSILIKAIHIEFSKKKKDSFYYTEEENNRSIIEIRRFAKYNNNKGYYQLLAAAKADLKYFKEDTVRFK